VNLPKYAGGLSLAPDAVGNDGHLDVCLFRLGSLLRGLGYLAAVVQGRHRGLRDVVYKRVRGLRLEADGDVPYQLDGDPGGVLPVTITARPGRLRLLVSETWAVQHGFQHDGACARVTPAGGANPIDP
jgi:diacylglycerol kinase family enzyme